MNCFLLVVNGISILVFCEHDFLNMYLRLEYLLCRRPSQKSDNVLRDSICLNFVFIFFHLCSGRHATNISSMQSCVALSLVNTLYGLRSSMLHMFHLRIYNCSNQIVLLFLQVTIFSF